MEQEAVSIWQDYVEIIAVSVLVLGSVGAHVARRLCDRGLRLIDAWLAQNATTEDTFVSPSLIRVAQNMVFWLVIVVTIVIALRILGVGGFSDLLDGVVGYLPKLIIAIAIIGIGHLVGLLCRGLIARLSDSIEPDSLAPRLAHGSILIVAVVVGLQQLDIDITFVTQLLLVLLSIAAGGLVLSFALGSRQHVANLIGRSELQRYSVGDRIRIDDEEGTIVEIHQTGLDLVTGQGVLSVPASRFSEACVLKLAGGSDGE